MSGTLTEAKAELGVIQGLQEAHKRECPLVCHRAEAKSRRRPACDQRDELAAAAKRQRQLIKTWFDPSPDDPTLF